MHDFAGFNAQGNNTRDNAILIFDQVDREPLVHEGRISFYVGLIKGMQQRMAGTVSSSAGACSLPAFTKIFGLSAKRPLVDPA